MKRVVKNHAGILSILVALSCLAPLAYGLGPDGPRTKNNRGMYTVKCQVHQNTTGNPVVGFVIGNHKNDPEKAEKKQITSFPDSVTIMLRDTVRQLANTGKTVLIALTGLQDNIEIYAK